MKKIGRVKYVTKGIYDPAVTYKKQDVVLYEGSLWEPKQETTGNPPPDHQRNEDGTPASNEFWQLFLPGALGDDYVKKTDIAKPPTDSTHGKAGIVIPDGKTIQIDENGLMTETPLDFNGTWDELFEGIESGEVKNGMIGYIKGTKSDPDNPNHPNSMLFDIDDYLSLISSNAVQNRIITAALNQIKQLAEQNAHLIEDVKGLRASVNAFGLAKVCPVSVTDVTEDNGIVLGGFEKNAAVAGSIMNFAEKNKQLIESLSESSFIFRGTITDFNSVEKSGFYQYPGGNGVGVPQQGAFGILLNLRGDSYKYQIFLSINGDYKFIFIRSAATLSANYSSWNYIELK